MRTTTNGAASAPRFALRPALKQTLLNVVARLPDGVQRSMFAPPIRRVFVRVPVLRAVYSGCLRRHPIDIEYGVDTSGLADAPTQSDAQLAGQLCPYMGSQPTIIRRALDTLGNISGYTFIDMGCGKGRPLIVASEYAFSLALGYDISADLVRTANANAVKIAQRFPHRPPIRAVSEGVSEMKLPAGNAVVFLYNPFGRDLMASLLGKLEAALESGSIRHLFVVYDNPVCGEIFDRSVHFKRWFSGVFAYDAREVGYGPELEESVVIWQSLRGARTDLFADRERRIVVKDRLSASLE